jgi:hypothetical protein
MAELLTFVVTHKPVEWDIPFAHEIITVGEYHESSALNSSDYLPQEINVDRALAWFRFIPAAIDRLQRVEESVGVVAVNHRTAFSKRVVHGVSRPVKEFDAREILKPEYLKSNWEKLILQDFPDGADFLVTNVVDFGCSSLQNYAACHHLEDLLGGFSLAVRLGLVKSSDVEWYLQNRLFINLFAAKKEFFVEVYSKVWKLGLAFFETFRSRRAGYQERYANFMLERFVSLLLLKEISRNRERFMSTKYFAIDPDGIYRPGS